VPGPRQDQKFSETYRILYFIEPGSLSSFFPTTDHDHPGFPEPFLTLRPFGDSNHQIAALDPEFASVATVESSLFDLEEMYPVRWAHAKVAVLTEFYGSENYGHQIADAAFSLFLIQEMFGLVSRDTEFIAYRSCKSNCFSNRFCAGVAHEHRWEWCEHQLPMILASLSRLPLQFLDGTVPPDQSVYRAALGSGPLCFENLLMGMGQLTFRRSNIGMGSIWRAFRDFFIAGIPGPDKPATPRVPFSLVILDRVGLSRRNWINAQTCAARLREELGSWDIQLMDLRRQPSLAYLHIIHRAQVLVTPGGGFAFASIFLPNSACAVYIDSWRDQEVPPRSVRHVNEGALWDNLGYIRATYYRRFAHEPGEVQSRKANFTVDPQRLLSHVAVCIRHTLSK
jgi:hypothetical protein